jgi:hypothetical protein
MLLHHICASQVNSDNIHQGLESIFYDKHIQLLLGVVKENVGLMKTPNDIG